MIRGLANQQPTGPDDKPETQTARRMMQMVLSIKANDTVDFRNNEVTCFTCHRGQRQPVSLPVMPLTHSGHEDGPEDPTARTPAALSQTHFVRPVLGLSLLHMTESALHT